MNKKDNMDYDGMGDFSRFPNQGKRNKQVKDSEKLASLGMFGLLVMIFGLMIANIVGLISI